MFTRTYDHLVSEAKDIRIKVFMKEQGFQNEFDKTDSIAYHIVAFEGTTPIGTCRFFKEDDHYTIGRVAVLKEYRSKHVGHILLDAAEEEIKKLNGQEIIVHAQVRVNPFYEKKGYIPFGEMDDDEGVPHMWMKKKIQ